jgi:hypothetical protein
LGGEILHMGNYYLITPYPPFSACEWGRDGMDCIGWVWMTSSIISTSSIMALRCSFSLWGTLSSIFCLVKVCLGRYNISTCIPPFSARRGGREWVDGTYWIWMTLLLWESKNYLGRALIFCLPSFYGLRITHKLQ